MPGCQSYALTARSRSPLLLSLPQQTMNWEWKSVGKQGKYEKAPLWAWKKTFWELFFLIITLQDWGQVSYTQSQFKTPLKYRKKWPFLPQGWKAGPLLQWKGAGEREGAGLGWRGKGEPQRARLTPPTSQARDTDPSCDAGGSCLRGFPGLWHRWDRQRGYFTALSFCSPSLLPALSAL